MADESTEEERGITMVEVLQEAEELENSAEAVLGAGDDAKCSYEKGYMMRQALYCCLTCCPIDGNILAGICLGCSYHCHEGHDLVELYTKRMFRCDCGTSKFAENPCKLNTNKNTNAENTYNQNFRGKYCTCGRPYPDPEDTTDDQMMQCIICEDWYHGRHLKTNSLPEENNYDEMICHLCSVKLPFLQHYSGLSVVTVTKDDTIADVEIEDKKEEVKADSNETSMELSNEGCKLKNKKDTSEFAEKAIFFIDNWRKQLCSCDDCKRMYKELKVDYLLLEDDTVNHYESLGKAKRQRSNSVERELEALSSLDRFTRTEVVHEYNNLSTSLREYLKKFADNGKIVSGDDIKEFFAELSSRKRQKTGEGMSYFCK